jgi:hypothetical protein
MTNRPEHAPSADSNEVVYAFFEHFLRPEVPKSEETVPKNVER